MEIREIFENIIKIEPKVMSIESLFNNPERVDKTNFKPSYQRNYVWDDEKATYFIESILLGTEIPPLIYFRNSDKVEVIDGRQRYQTILRFIGNEFKLKKNGLQKLENIGIANKSFKDINSDLQDLFWDTKLRIIEFSFHSQNLIDEEIEEIVKKEIFKRYNSGITPLKPTEIDNAVYFDNDLNSFIKHKLKSDSILFRNISSILHFEKTSNEIILKKIRQLLVQHQIPIKYYAVKKDTVISKYYEFLFSNINEAEIQDIYNSFIEKVNLLTRIKASFPNKGILYNRLISECLFWVFSILENEKLSLQLITKEIISDIVTYITENIDVFAMVRSSFAKELHNRYFVTAEFFSKKFNVDFAIYLQYNSDFKQKYKDLTPIDEERISFDELRINKPEPSSIAIMDICRQMERQRFLIRPPYQRNEVINKKKSSSIIESILLGIKLPPIFVYKRKDEISEVLDGQQRLLSILGFIQKPYLDENNKSRRSDKDGYALNLKNSILKNLNGKRFEQLSPEQKDKIKNFDLWIIEISHKNNNNFEPIDLFIRLNNKPYPIKEETFEMWNSYISRDIIDTLKSIHKNHSDWFYIRKNNSRMEDENIYTTLAYFQFSWNRHEKPFNYSPKELDIYKVVNKINFRVKSKNEITKVLEDGNLKDDFIKASNELEFNFIKKLKSLLSEVDDNSFTLLNKNLDEIFNIENGRRTQQGFYALWYFLFDIPLEVITDNKIKIRQGLKSLFAYMAEIESKPAFDSKVLTFKEKFKINNSLFDETHYKAMPVDIALLGEITNLSPGVNIQITLARPNLANSKSLYPYLKKGDFLNYQPKLEDIGTIDINENPINKEFFDLRAKILIKKALMSNTRFTTAFFDTKLAFAADTIGIVTNRSGFLPKYLLCIISSRYCFNRFYKKFIHNKLDEIKPVGLNDIRNISIPIISLKEQRIFGILAGYILNANISIESRYFYERLIDAIVYEIFFAFRFREAGIQVMKYLSDLPDLNNISDTDGPKKIGAVYEELSNPAHEISASLLKLLNITEIQKIEEFV